MNFLSKNLSCFTHASILPETSRTRTTFLFLSTFTATVASISTLVAPLAVAPVIVVSAFEPAGVSFLTLTLYVNSSSFELAVQVIVWVVSSYDAFEGRFVGFSTSASNLMLIVFG